MGPIVTLDLILGVKSVVRGVAQSIWRRPYKILNTGWIFIQLGSFERREYTELEKWKNNTKKTKENLVFFLFSKPHLFQPAKQEKNTFFILKEKLGMGRTKFEESC